MPPHEEDALLMLRAGHGDRDAFAELVDRHQSVVARFIHRYLGRAQTDTLEDLVQQVFFLAWRSAPNFEPRARVQTWLLTIATNVCLNLRRTQRRRPLTLIEPDQAAAAPDRRSEPAEAAVDADETARIVRAALATLPDRQRAALLLRHYHEMTYNEIAESLGISLSAVETLLFRARSSLRQRLIDAGAFPMSPSSQESRVRGSETPYRRIR